MTKTEFLQTMRQTKARTAPPALPEAEEKPLSQPTAASSPFRGAYGGEDCNPSVSATHCQLPYRGAYSGEDCNPSVKPTATSSTVRGAYGGKERTACAAALRRAGIPADTPYYAGAFRNVEQALASRKPQSVAFWQAYLLSLCGQLERLEREAEPEEKPLSQPTAASSPFRGAYSGEDCNPSVSATHCQLPYRGAYSGEDCNPSVSLAAASSAQGTSFGRPFRGAEIERQQLRGGIRTVQAVLYALQETERTENEPRETA